MLKHLLIALLACTAARVPAQEPTAALLNRKAPEIFRVLFNTTKGSFIIEANRKWSPLGVDRLYQLVLSGYFTNNLVFRAEPGYVVQFGIAEQSAVRKFWYERYIPDEPALQKHTRGMVAFARDRRNTRSTQLFIDLADNPKLDTTLRDGVKGFPPIAKLVKGMEVVESFYSKYGREPAAQQIDLYRKGNAYYEALFPGLDKILSARILP